MKKNKIEIVILVTLILSLIHTIVLYPTLPNVIPTHWGLSGEIDGWGHKSMVFVFQLISWGIYISMYIIPKIDPKKENYKRFASSYVTIKLIIILLFVCLIEVSMMAAVNPESINMNKIVTIGISVIFIVIGNYFPKCKQNYTFGIKTPWTLNNEQVWNDTHRFSGLLWLISGIIMLFVSLFIPEKYAVIAVLIITIIVAFAGIVYSYFSYKKYTNK